MNGVLEHEVDEVGGGFDELVQLLQVLELASLFLIKDIKVVFRGVQLHILHLRLQVSLLFCDFLIALLQFLLLFLERPDLLVDLFFHHLVKILLLYFKLLHDASERFLEPVDFVIELFAHLEFQLRVELLAGRGLSLVHLDLVEHLLDHPLHIEN